MKIKSEILRSVLWLKRLLYAGEGNQAGLDAGNRN